MPFWSYVPFYQEGTFEGAQPTTIADFFNVKKFPGKRGIHTWPNALIEMALLADGVAIKDVYKVMSTDEGIDRAFKMLDKIKDHAVFWSSGAKPLERTVDTGISTHHLVNVFGRNAISQQRHFDQRVRPGVDTTLAREFLDVEEISNRFRLCTTESAFFIERNVRPEDLRNHAVIGYVNHDVVIH